MITASDASVDFGFGVAAAECTQARARAVGRLSERRGDYVRLLRGGDSEDEAERTRIGKPHQLGLRKSAFRTILSARRKHDAHAGSLEATGVHLLLRWLARVKKRHGHRVVALIDAKAILCAAAKGRTSSESIRGDLRKIAALTIAADLHMHYVYVPSEDNQADAPSRGVIRKISKGARDSLHRRRGHGQRTTKEAAARAREKFDPVDHFLRRAKEVAEHTGDRGLVAKWEHRLGAPASFSL